MKNQPYNHAFTLMELLVVVAVIGILASLLLPALSHAKQRALSIRCLNHHRQLILGWTMYAGDNNGDLSPNNDSIGRVRIMTNWVAGTLTYGVDATNSLILTDPKKTLLASYVKGAKLFKCPGDRSRFVRSISMNCWVNPTRATGPPSWIGGIGTNYQTFQSLDQIRTPGKILITLDERSDSINEAYFGIDLSNTGKPEGDGNSKPYYLIDYPANYHNGAGVVSFADGHIENHKWLESTTKPTLGNARPVVFTSPKDRDVAWLQSHATHPR